MIVSWEGRMLQRRIIIEEDDNCDTLYISQNYFRLPRQTIRENSNFIILFPQDVKNLNHIYADHCSSDMSKEEFKEFCKDVWVAGRFLFNLASFLH